MADDLPDAPWAGSGNTLPDAPWIQKPMSSAEHMKAAGTDIWPEIKNAAGRAWTNVSEGLNPWSKTNNEMIERHKQAMREKGFLGSMPEALESGKQTFGQLISPLTGAFDIAQQPFVTPLAHALSAAPGGESYEKSREKAEYPLMALAPGRGVRSVPVPPRPTLGPFGVTLSEGQKTGELAAIQREQAALRNAKEPGHERAQEFKTQQAQELERAQEDVAKGLDPFNSPVPGAMQVGGGRGQIIAETPHEAGDIVSRGIQQTAAQRKAVVDQAYKQAQAFPGEIHASAFDDIGNNIKQELSNRAEPIIIDDRLTPFADRALRDVEERIAKLQIQNRADPLGVPNPQSIVGVNLRGVDQARKRLSSFRQQAYGSGNATDGRATKAVIDAFDAHVDRAVNGGLFNGDPRAIQAWNDARAAHSDYRSTFTAQKNDPVGRVVEKIIGKGTSAPATGNAVADFLYDSTGVNPSDLVINTAKRVKTVLGEQSPEWIGAKQGLFTRLVEAGPGMTDWGPGKIAQRLNRFLNGDGIELSRVMLSPAERQMLQEYANLMRRLEVPQAGANWSNTSTFQKGISKVGSTLGMLVGAALGRITIPGMGLLGEAAGAGTAKAVGKIGDVSQARQIAKQMPLVAQQIKKWQKAVATANKANSPPSKKALAVASANLTQSLQRVGISPQMWLSHAGEDENNAPRPRDQKKDGGVVDGSQGFAHGGRVDPDNIHPSPSEAQKKAGNYSKDHVHIHGLDLTIENAKGSFRRGVDKGGKPWAVKMPSHYGYFKRTEGKDGDQVDCYLGQHVRSPRVFIVDQLNAETRQFDEHKCFLGFASKASAVATYHKAFSDGRSGERLGHVTEMNIEQFKDWLDKGNTTKPASAPVNRKARVAAILHKHGVAA